MKPPQCRGRFAGALDASRETTLPKVLRWKLSHLLHPCAVKPAATFPLADNSHKLDAPGDLICWLGHASFLLRLGGKGILIDPVFGDIPFFRRNTPFPYALQSLLPVGAILLTHTHYDHFDLPTLRLFCGGGTRALLPFNAGRTLRSKAPGLPFKELEWYESCEVGEAKVTFVPARHMSRRTPFDNNRALWGGFVVEHGGRCIYCSGDTGPGPHFETIGKRFDIDYALLPIGAYKPEFVMRSTHLSPADAYDAFKALGAKRMIPMHYGTFDLSDEPMAEPLQWMRRIAYDHPEEVLFLTTGEVINL